MSDAGSRGAGAGEPVRYRFPPLERRGLIAGWRGGQIASVCAGLLLAVLALRSRPSVGGVVLGVAMVAASVALAFWPVRGRTGEQWLPLLVRRARGAVSGHLQAAPGPQIGHRVVNGTNGRTEVCPPSPSGVRRPLGRRSVFEGVEVVAARTGRSGGSDAVGMVLDRPSRTASAVLVLAGRNFALLGPGDQDARIASWARVFSTVAREGSEVHRLQWIESCTPDDGRGIRCHLDTHAQAGSDSPEVRSYRLLVDESSPVTRRHLVLLAVSIHTARTARSIRASGGGRVGTAAVLLREVAALHRALEAADVAVEGALGPNALVRRIAATFASGGRAPGQTWVDPADEVDGPVSRWPWPMAIEPAWDAVHADSTWHATYWIAEWPRLDVRPDFLGPLLFAPLRRSICLTMEPVSPGRAARQVAQARTADLADGELRRRGGFLTTARHARERESVEAREVELADGHAQYRFSGYVTVTAETREELTRSCAALEQVAGQARLELRLLYGEQDVALACALPIGRGLA